MSIDPITFEPISRQNGKNARHIESDRTISANLISLYKSPDRGWEFKSSENLAAKTKAP